MKGLIVGLILGFFIGYQVRFERVTSGDPQPY